MLPFFPRQMRDVRRSPNLQMSYLLSLIVFNLAQFYLFAFVKSSAKQGIVCHMSSKHKVTFLSSCSTIPRALKVTKIGHHSGHDTSTVYISFMEKIKKLKFDWYSFITLMEKTLLVVIAFLTAYAVLVEIISVVSIRAVKLTDLLLLFIYAEVLGMVAAFYKYRKIPITVPIFIAITALCRLIILQGKGINTIDLLYESSAILLLAVSALVIRWNLVNLIRPGSATDEKDRD